MIKHVAFFVYPVSDMARARQFYEGILGLKLEHNYEDHWLEYDIQGFTMALTDWMEDATYSANAGSVGLEVANAEQTFAFLKSQGVKVVKDLFDTPVCRMGIIADPDGNGIVIHQALVAH